MWLASRAMSDVQKELCLSGLNATSLSFRGLRVVYFTFSAGLPQLAVMSGFRAQLKPRARDMATNYVEAIGVHIGMH